jgi:C-terminal processing protease CtpA/Prc
VAESPAEEAGLRAGDLIVRVNGQNCADGNVKLFKKLVEKARETGVLKIRVKRNGSHVDTEAKLTQITEKQIQRVVAAHMKAAHPDEKR